ncbi:hypothetical protein NQ317_016746 [Molorchus minor]|uniref:HTH CENPB-type domain-containing protein n=1 Tax=Molorchus minor TaxID=1323400 RepID=A0ABQ9J1D2_9CUCU|nr:hypothetical protein NQ317_016746 [Molorchus minor]
MSKAKIYPWYPRIKLLESLALSVMFNRAAVWGLRCRNVPIQVQKNTAEKIQKALNEIKRGLSKKAVAKKFGIPRSTLQFRLGNRFKKIRHGPNTYLTEEEEYTIVSWILDSHRKGFPRRKDDIVASVKKFLDENPRNTPFHDNIPGKHWFQSFLNRHPVLASRTPEAVTSASSNVSESDIQKWFNDIEQYLNEKGYFEIVQDPTHRKSISSQRLKNVYEVDQGNAKSNLMVMFTFGVSGMTTPPMVIYPYKRLPPQISDSVPKGWGIGISDNGWMKSESFFEILQPADVACFRSLKALWKRGVLKWRRNNPFCQLTKTDFAPILNEIIFDLEPKSISNGFRACGNCPWNVDSIEFTKSLGKQVNRDTPSENPHTASMDFNKFVKLIGPTKFEQLRDISLNGLHSSTEDFKILYEIYRSLCSTENITEKVDSTLITSDSYNDEVHLLDRNDCYGQHDIDMVVSIHEVENVELTEDTTPNTPLREKR